MFPPLVSSVSHAAYRSIMQGTSCHSMGCVEGEGVQRHDSIQSENVSVLVPGLVPRTGPGLDQSQSRKRSFLVPIPVPVISDPVLLPVPVPE